MDRRYHQGTKNRVHHFPTPVHAELTVALTAAEPVVGVARVHLKVPHAVAVRAGDLDGARDSPLLGKDELFHDEEVERVHQALSVLKARVLTEDLGGGFRECVQVEAERSLVPAEAFRRRVGQARQAAEVEVSRGFSDPYRRQEWLVYVGFCAPSLDTPAGFANASFQAGAGFESGGLLCRTGVNHQIVDGAAFGPQC